MNANYAAVQYGYSGEPTVPGTLSGEYDPEWITWSRLLREGLLALVITLVVTGLQSTTMGTSHAVRMVIVIEGFCIVLIGMAVARTMGGRLFLAVAYAVLFERSYFLPPRIWVLTLSPSMLLAGLLLVMSANKSMRPPLLTKCAGGPRTAIYVLTALILGGALVAANFSPFGMERGVWAMLDQRVPMIVFAAAGAMVLRRGTGHVFWDLLPYLAAANAVTIWVYSLTGTRVLFYQDLWSYKEVIDRFGGMLRNANNSGFFCALAILVTLLRFHRARGLLKLIMLANAVFLAGTIVVLRSRGPILVLVLLLPVLLLHKRSRLATAAFCVVGAIGYVGYGSALTVGQSRAGRHETLAARMESVPESVALRWKSYMDIVLTISRNPFGVGEHGGAISSEFGAVTGFEAHNEYLAFLARNGFQTLGSLVLLMSVIIGCWAMACQERFPHRPGMLLIVALIAFMITFGYEPILSNCHELGAIFCTTLGMFTASCLFAMPQASLIPMPVSGAGLGIGSPEQLPPVGGTGPAVVRPNPRHP